ncbi:tautomerase family protein [Kocuria sp.]|uniref:tautomerase family protein n=1 Tax=Kocuria sp. TaxID=1871328 RepID=UPI0026E0CC15|nr:tautomerase family protein [Kocuria sp.]MDO5368213.1 tautomerase family protein [Kocuria sp.]
MPLVDISIARGRTPEQLRDLIANVHDAVEHSVGAAPENITVIVREVEPRYWARANQTVAERASANK